MARRPEAKKAGAQARGLPGKDEILEYIKTSPTKAGKREIARAFDVAEPQRVGLNRLLDEHVRGGHARRATARGCTRRAGRRR